MLTKNRLWAKPASLHHHRFAFQKEWFIGKPIPAEEVKANISWRGKGLHTSIEIALRWDIGLVLKWNSWLKYTSNHSNPVTKTLLTLFALVLFTQLYNDRRLSCNKDLITQHLANLTQPCCVSIARTQLRLERSPQTLSSWPIVSCDMHTCIKMMRVSDKLQSLQI